MRFTSGQNRHGRGRCRPESKGQTRSKQGRKTSPRKPRAATLNHSPASTPKIIVPIEGMKVERLVAALAEIEMFALREQVQETSRRRPTPRLAFLFQ